MARLNDAQRYKLVKYAGRDAATAVRRNRDVLLFYGTLRPEQKALAADAGLSADRLDVAQRKLLQTVLERVRPGPATLPRALQRVELWEEPRETMARAEFVFRDSERYTVRLNRLASPVPDPWNTRNLMLP